jgi:hypothetical protein
VVTITGKVEEEELFRQRFEPGIFLSAYYTSSVSYTTTAIIRGVGKRVATQSKTEKFSWLTLLFMEKRVRYQMLDLKLYCRTAFTIIKFNKNGSAIFISRN